MHGDRIERISKLTLTRERKRCYSNERSKIQITQLAKEKERKRLGLRKIEK